MDCVQPAAAFDRQPAGESSPDSTAGCGNKAAAGCRSPTPTPQQAVATERQQAARSPVQSSPLLAGGSGRLQLPPMSSTFGHVFRIHTFGESHGGGVGVVIDGCPPRIPVSAGKHPARTRPPPPRPVRNRHPAQGGRHRRNPLRPARRAHPRHPDLHHRPQHRPTPRLPTTKWPSKYRPSHADYTYDAKYGIRAPSGGGRASARETIGRVAAAAVARQVLDTLAPRHRNPRLGEIHPGPQRRRRSRNRHRRRPSSPTSSAPAIPPWSRP